MKKVRGAAPQARRASRPSSRSGWLIFCVVLIAGVFWLWRGARIAQPPPALPTGTAPLLLPTNTAVEPQKPKSGADVSEKELVGRWVRADGGYIIDIREVRADGRLDAAYYNPKPINVSRAEYQREGDALGVFVELRDVNYPGATYRLRLHPEQGLLKGEYTQPAIGQTFEVEFSRAP